MEFVGTSGNDILTGTSGNDTIDGGVGNDQLFGGAGDDLIRGGANRDLIRGGGNTLDTLITEGGRDSLEGGEGNDAYFVSATSSGGTVIFDEQGDGNAVNVVAENTDLDTIFSFVNFSPEDLTETFADPAIWGDSAIKLSTPEEGMIGLERSGRDLIIDTNRDGVAETENDLTIANYFDEEGNLGEGAPFHINNLTDRENIVSLFSSNPSEESDPSESDDDSGTSTSVYRFFDSNTGSHFYTVNEAEKDALLEVDNYSFEGESYYVPDPLTGETTPVYRFLNEDTGTHLYTIQEEERIALLELDNFSFEGEAFSTYGTEVEGAIPIYRLFDTLGGTHLYTPSANERDTIEATLPNYESEGIAYYALPRNDATDI